MLVKNILSADRAVPVARTYLLLGGTGTISTGCVEFLRHGHEVTCMNRGSRQLPAGVEQIICDVNDEAAVAKVMEGRYFDVVVDFLTYDPEQDRDMIHHCDIRESGPFFLREETDYRSPYYTADSPDAAGLARCRAIAEEIGQTHGIQVLIGEEAAATEPWDYDLEPEYLVPVLLRELQLLQTRLAHYPDGFLADTASHFSRLKLCLVRSIRGSTDSGSPDYTTGLQFQEGADTYVAIALGVPSEQALYHELFHVIETRILSESKAFDQWNDLNPAGFCYDYDYTANAQRDSGVYLFEDHRFFVDTYSMSFPKEDRARIMEYAMLPGMEDLFRSEGMQKKLKTLCHGIRDAYNLETYEAPLLWEQYLE